MRLNSESVDTTEGRERGIEENDYFEGHRRSSTMAADAEMSGVQDIYWD